MKFKNKNKKKPFIADVDKPEKENTLQSKEVNNKKNKRKFPEAQVEENDVESQSVKRSKKEKKIQPAIEENDAEVRQDTGVLLKNNDVESPSGKKSKKRKNKQPAIEENVAEEKRDSEVISKSNDIESQFVKKSKKKKKIQSTIDESDAQEEQDTEIISKSNDIESQFVKKSKKNEKNQSEIEENDVEKKQDTEDISKDKGKDFVAQKSDLIKTKTDDSKTGKKPPLPHQNKAERESRTIFIGNLPVNVKKKKIQKLVEEFGQIESFRIRGAIPECDKISKKVAVNKKMFNKDQQSLVAYAVFKNVQDAQKALNLNGQVFEDHHLRVTLQTEKIADKNKGIFIGNLKYKVTEEEIWDFFKDSGEISSVRVIRDDKTGLCKGFGYVNFKSEDSVEFALKLEGEKLQDREIRIKRLFSEGKLEKLKKKKQFIIVKNNQSNDKFKSRKQKFTNDKPGFNKKFQSKTDKSTNDKPGFKSKRKTVNKVDFKKKKLAEKLMSKPKKKPVAS